MVLSLLSLFSGRLIMQGRPAARVKDGVRRARSPPSSDLSLVPTWEGKMRNAILRKDKKRNGWREGLMGQGQILKLLGKRPGQAEALSVCSHDSKTCCRSAESHADEGSEPPCCKQIRLQPMQTARLDHSLPEV